MWGIPLSEQGGRGACGADDRVLRSVFYGGERENIESGENGADAGSARGLSDGAYGGRRDDPADAGEV